MTSSIDDLRQRLESFIAQQTASAVTLTNLQPIAGGASRDTWVFDLMLTEGRDKGMYQLVLRRDMGSSKNPHALNRAQEFRLMRAARQYGVQVPCMQWVCMDPAILGTPFLIMQRVEGEGIGARIVHKPEFASARAVLQAQMARQLALIHAIDPTIDGVHDLPQPEPGRSPAQHALQGMRQLAQSLDLHNPAVEWALRWLDQHAPHIDTLKLVHGDFRIGNLLVGTEGLHAVIDWEFAHFGDPHEDLAWLCVRDWRFGNDALRVGGIAQLEPFLAAYAAAGGGPVDRIAMHWWEILGNLRWSVTCLIQAQRHLSGSNPSIELASLGRRATEMEWEYLRLIEETKEASCARPT